MAGGLKNDYILTCKEALREDSCSGDKSLSHRAVILGALAEEKRRFPFSGGRLFEYSKLPAAAGSAGCYGEDRVIVKGVGLEGLRERRYPNSNSGTTARLLLGCWRPVVLLCYHRR